MWLRELLEDECGRLSISRLLPLLICLFILATAAAVSIKRGEFVAVPETWVGLMTIALGGYVGAKGVTVGLGGRHVQDADGSAPEGSGQPQEREGTHASD